MMTDESKSILNFNAHNLWASDFLRGASYLYSSLKFSTKFSLNLQGNKKNEVLDVFWSMIQTDFHLLLIQTA